ncbi:hypothetical protein ABZ867_12650 [Streptomyces cinnamoneus]
MSHIIAGDPAPTNPTAEARAHLFGFIEVGAQEEDFPSFAAALNKYDALKRKEVLAEAANAVAAEIADGEHDPDCLVDHILYLAEAAGGESRG